MKKTDPLPGLSQPIRRRDFLGGMGVALSGSLIGCPWAETETPNLGLDDSSPILATPPLYPPTQTGLRGNHAGSFEVAHRLRDAQTWNPEAIQETGEEYDLVIVGGGISGLSAAWFYREKKPDARILILDNHDDFGGHAKRNEFWLDGRMHLSHGGTINITDFNYYGEAARRLIQALGIDVARYPQFHDDQFYTEQGTSDSVFFNKEDFGADRLVDREGEQPWRDFFSRTPLAPDVQKDLVRLFESDTDYLPQLNLEEKKRYLRSVSYETFLLDNAEMPKQAALYMNDAGYWAIGIDALSAWAATYSGFPGTQGLGFDTTEAEERSFFQFPDGNASIARLLVRALIPEVAPGQTVEDSVTANFDYSRIDQKASLVRLRLNSTVVNVKHLGPAQTASQVEVDYVRQGQTQRVRAKHVVLACYNSVIPYICSELPTAQKTALSQSLKAPLIYTSVLVRNWSAFKKLGTHDIRCLGCYFEDIRLAPPLNMGDYSHSHSPEDPTVVRLFRIPVKPGLSAQEQWKAGRHEILATSFETYEREIREQMDRVLGPGGFDSTRDIEAITVNRWPHGYAYGQNAETGEVAFVLDEFPYESGAWVQGRKRYGRIAIANSDAAADAMTESAIGEAHRAVSELIPS